MPLKRFVTEEWFITGTMVIFCIRVLNRPGPPFKGDSDPLQTSMTELVFEPISSCHASSAPTSIQGGRLVIQ